MSERVGAAQRPRERGLRAWHRHERLTVTMEQATALHHSAQRPKPVVEVPSEGVEGETYSVSRHQMPPSPGTRPGCSERARPASGCGARGLPVLQWCSSLGPTVAGASRRPRRRVAFLLTQPLVQRQTETDIRKEKEEAKLKQLGVVAEAQEAGGVGGLGGWSATHLLGPQARLLP